MKENKLITSSKIQQDFQAINVFDDLDFRVEEISNRFLQHVLDYMEEKNMTRKTLASLIGTSPSYITQLFNNTRTLNLVTIAKIEQALNVRFEVELQEIASVQNSYESPISNLNMENDTLWNTMNYENEELLASLICNDYNQNAYLPGFSHSIYTKNYEQNENFLYPANLAMAS